jgi:hypothetical protein
MPKKRELKDAAADSMVKKNRVQTKKPSAERGGTKRVAGIVLVFLVGLVGGVVSSQFLKFRL